MVAGNAAIRKKQTEKIAYQARENQFLQIFNKIKKFTLSNKISVPCITKLKLAVSGMALWTNKPTTIYKQVMHKRKKENNTTNCQ